MPFFIKRVLFPTLIFVSVFIIILYFINDYQKTDDSAAYMLKSYRNTVALYKNDELIKTYDHIVLNTLPEKDIQSFNSGISVTTQTAAENYLEDFD